MTFRFNNNNNNKKGAQNANWRFPSKKYVSLKESLPRKFLCMKSVSGKVVRHSSAIYSCKNGWWGTRFSTTMQTSPSTWLCIHTFLEFLRLLKTHLFCWGQRRLVTVGFLSALQLYSSPSDKTTREKNIRKKQRKKTQSVRKHCLPVPVFHFWP